MRNLLIVFALGFSAILAGCGGGAESVSATGILLKGNITDANGMQVFFDRLSFENASEVLAKTDLSSGGGFSIPLDPKPGPGVYRMRIGAQRIPIILDGNEKIVEVSGSLKDISNLELSVSGSESTLAMIDAEKKRRKGELNAQNIQSWMTGQNALVSSYVAHQTLKNTMSKEAVDALQSAKTKLQKEMPGTEFTKGFAKTVDTKAAGLASFMAQEAIKVGKPAPDINLPNPKGKDYALSQLKGKVVLLDFWASWCGPCRRENPHVVEIYNKYNKKGFEVFSVSLDRSGDRWEDAIKKDKLAWPYHVSDLKHWQSLPAKTYGVRGIPRTFLIDREGNIAAIGLRGAAQIENEVKKLL